MALEMPFHSLSRTQSLKGIEDAANETIAAEPMQGSCRSESASVFSLVTSDSVTSQEPGAVWPRILTIAENITIQITWGGKEMIINIATM